MANRIPDAAATPRAARARSLRVEFGVTLAILGGLIAILSAILGSLSLLAPQSMTVLFIILFFAGLGLAVIGVVLALVGAARRGGRSYSRVSAGVAIVVILVAFALVVFFFIL